MNCTYMADSALAAALSGAKEADRAVDHSRAHQGRSRGMPWLITRFVNLEAEFLFVAEPELLARAEREGATPFDATRLPDVRLNHRGDRCTFEAILEDYRLSDPALHRLGKIVRAADVNGQEHIAPEGLGLRVIAEGFAIMSISDHERLRLEFPVYDALYACAQRHTSGDRAN